MDINYNVFYAQQRMALNSVINVKHCHRRFRYNALTTKIFTRYFRMILSSSRKTKRQSFDLTSRIE